MATPRYPDRWVTVVTGEVMYVGDVTLLDGHTSTGKDEADRAQATRFDVKTRTPWRRGYESAIRAREFWCLYLGERPSFLMKGARVMVLVELNRRWMGESCTTWDSAYLAHLILDADAPLPENGPESSLDLFVHTLAKVGA